jgi:glutathione S-transferase
MSESIKLFGALGSPYSMKMRALLRYRRIPFEWILGLDAQRLAQSIRPPVIPIVEYPDGTLMNDSTALIFVLEKRRPNARSVVPPDPAMAFLALLIEDFAGEWITKSMFSYRWLRPRD